MPLIEDINSYLEALSLKEIEVKVLAPIPHVKKQKGPNCGSYAVEAVTKYIADNKSLQPFLSGEEKTNIPARNRDINNNNNNQEKSLSLRHILRKDLGVRGVGGVLDIYKLKELSERIGFGARVLYAPDIDEFTQMICQAIDRNLAVIVALNVEGGMDYLPPSTTSLGNDAHYATVVAYYKNDNAILFIMAEDNIYYEVDALELQAANESAVYFNKQTYTKKKSIINKDYWTFFERSGGSKIDENKYKLFSYPSMPLDTCFAARCLLVYPADYDKILSAEPYLQPEILQRGDSSLVAKQLDVIAKLEAQQDHRYAENLTEQLLIERERGHLLKARIKFIEALNQEGIDATRNVINDYNLDCFYDKKIMINLALTALHNYRHDVAFEMINDGLSIDKTCDGKLFLTDDSVLSFTLKRMCLQDLSFLIDMIEYQQLTVESIADQDESESFIMYLLTMYDSNISSQLINKLIEVDSKVNDYQVWGRPLKDYLSFMHEFDNDLDDSKTLKSASC